MAAIENIFNVLPTALGTLGHAILLKAYPTVSNLMGHNVLMDPNKRTRALSHEIDRHALVSIILRNAATWIDREACSDLRMPKWM